MGPLQSTSDKWWKVAWQEFLWAPSVLLGGSHLAPWTCDSPSGAAGRYFLLNCEGFITLPISIFQLRGLSTLRITVLTIKDRSKEGIEYFSIFFILVAMFPSTSNNEWRFSLALILFLLHLWKDFLLSFTTVSRLNSCQASVFLIFSLHNLATSLSSSLTCLPLLENVIDSQFILGSHKNLHNYKNQVFCILAFTKWCWDFLLLLDLTM